MTIHPFILRRFALLAAAALLAGCQASPGSSAAAAPRAPLPPMFKPEPIQLEPLKLEDIIRKDDRIVFVGDDLTEQRYYTRSFSTAMLLMLPQHNLRIFNGGMNEATAASAMEWVDDLLDTCRPTVVFLCFGLNDGRGLPPGDALIEQYEASLAKLIDQVKARPGVREVVVMSSPAIQTGMAEENKGGYNRTLAKFAYAAQTQAALKKVKFVDLYEPMRVAYAEAARAGGDMLTLNGRLPTEDGHTVLASVLLWSIGVTREMLEPVGWAPLKPLDMGRVRGALGIPLREPPYEQGWQSRDIYEKLREADTAFFTAWRLAKGNRKFRSRPELVAAADARWLEVESLARSYAGTRKKPAENEKQP